MRQHFWDVQPLDLIRVPKEGKFDHCKQCGMKVHPLYPRHRHSKECQVSVERQLQREVAVMSALALRQEFMVRGDILQRVEVYKYLGWMMAQDKDDIQAIRAQLRKARSTWARVGQVLCSKNTLPFIAAQFYQAIIQAILLYGSKTWVISWTALARLEGFHILGAYQMAHKNKPWCGPWNERAYPRSEDVLKECGMKTIEEYIRICRHTIAVYIATRPIFNECRQGERKRGPYHTIGGGNSPWIWTSLMFHDPKPICAWGGRACLVGTGEGLICVGPNLVLRIVVKFLVGGARPAGFGKP